MDYRLANTDMRMPLRTWRRTIIGFALCGSSACGLATQAQSSDRFDAKSLGAAVSFAQSLAQWEFALIAGSLLVLVGTSYRHPMTRGMRLVYLLFLPGWAFLVRSIYLGSRAQEVYLAYMLVPVTTLQGATQRLNEYLGKEIFWMIAGLTTFFLWLLLYLIWWIFFAPRAETST